MNLVNNCQTVDNKDFGFISRIKRLITKKKANLSDIDPEDVELLRDIENAKCEWLNAYNKYEYADNKDDIEYHVYYIKACQVRYENLIKAAKRRGLKAECIKNEERSIHAKDSRLNLYNY